MTKTIFRVLACGLLPLLLFSCGSQTRNAQTPQNEQESIEGVSDPDQSYVSSGTINGHEWVDLGLPSGLKWATCNVGASCPEEYGDYFAWGETRIKSSYDKETSETFGKDIQWLLSNGYIGENGNPTLSHDAAYQNWGGTWRMPTKEEIKELIDNTTKEWTTRNGVFGFLVLNRKNGNSIFLPATGVYQGSSLVLNGEVGAYWGSTPMEDNSNKAYDFGFSSDMFRSDKGLRYRGFSIRPVSE